MNEEVVEAIRYFFMTFDVFLPSAIISSKADLVVLDIYNAPGVVFQVFNVILIFGKNWLMIQ